MKKFLYFLILCLLFSCGQNVKSDQPKVTIETKVETSCSDSLYKIVSEKENVNPKFGFNKCNIEVQLTSKIDKEVLICIANKIRQTRESYDHLWIFYNIKGQKSNIAWATTHFNPNLEVEIIGSTSEEDKKMNNISVDGDIIGEWNDTRAYAEHVAILYKKNNKIFMKRIFSDGSNGEDEFIIKTVKGKIRYEPKQNTHNEYFIIENNGNLGMYDNEGKFAEAIKK